ncbi:M50 family metallopeptidase [Xanthomonas sacchari]|uniref:M50 family metallopeptidase n=1 Tax=Xanthomonas sacchari TaxID=56458 RepID=UPI00224D4FBD|nr:M50 family metallopeptidase [Xanthomonas sacchari]MCW0373196.1 hypothetical protein [Xanthomonas sacchari]
MSSAGTTRGAWMPSPWLNRLLTGVQGVLLLIGISAMAVGAIALVQGVWAPGMVELPVILLSLPLAGMATVALHECGHVLAARAAGMTVYLIHIGPLQLHARRRGWRMRWRRVRPGHPIGFVLPVPDPSLSLRRQYRLTIVGGPAANLLVASIAWLAARCAGVDSNLGAFCVGIGVLNFAVALINLLPVQGRSGATDGLQWVNVAQWHEADAPAYVLAELNGWTCQGVTADRLSPSRLDVLARSDLALCHSWFALKAAQQRGQWRQAAELQPQMEQRLAEAGHAAAQWETLVMLLRCEFAFSRAMAGSAEMEVLDAGLTAEADWIAPALRPRCRALMAVRHADPAGAQAWLRLAEAAAEDQVDHALRATEAVLRDAIRGRLKAE